MVANISEGKRAGDNLRVLSGVGAAAMAGGAFAVWYFDPSTAGFFPACPLYTLTGFACPGCGMTRGFHALFHGDILTALDFNAMIPFALLFFGFIFVSLVSVAVRGRGLVIGQVESTFALGNAWPFDRFWRSTKPAVLSVHDSVSVDLAETRRSSECESLRSRDEDTHYQLMISPLSCASAFYVI